jgi:hypothetical protein
MEDLNYPDYLRNESDYSTDNSTNYVEVGVKDENALFAIIETIFFVFSLITVPIYILVVFWLVVRRLDSIQYSNVLVCSSIAAY